MKIKVEDFRNNKFEDETFDFDEFFDNIKNNELQHLGVVRCGRFEDFNVNLIKNLLKTLLNKGLLKESELIDLLNIDMHRQCRILISQ